MKIKTQIFIIGLFLSILPLVLVSGMLISFYNNELNNVAIDELESVTSAQIGIIDNFFQERDANLSILMEYDMLHRLLVDNYSDWQSDVRNSDKKVMENIFSTQKSKRSFIYSITALDSNFRVAASTETAALGEYSLLAHTPMLKNLDHDIWFSHIIEAGESGARNRCLVAVKAIYNDADDRIGYLVEELSLDFFSQLRLGTKLVEEGTVYIADGEGGIISAGTSEQDRQTFVLQSDQRGDFSEAWENRDQSQPLGVISYRIAGKTYLTSYGGFQNSNWQILSTVCLNDILHTGEKSTQVLVAVLFATGLMFLILNIIMRRVLSAPIERMVLVFAEIRKQKDFSKRITNVPHNEVGIIASEVNILLADIEITMLHQQESLKILKGRAERDPLTDLFNKNTIQEILTMKIDSAHVHHDMLAFVFVDIDDFKAYNTRFGHAGGDAVIRFTASLMRELSGDTAGRVGGDEFVMCLDSFSASKDVSRFLDDFVRRLQSGTDILGSGEKIPIPCSIGAAVLTGHHNLTYNAVIEMADKAMYRVKNSTKNGYFILTDKNESVLP